MKISKRLILAALILATPTTKAMFRLESTVMGALYGLGAGISIDCITRMGIFAHSKYTDNQPKYSLKKDLNFVLTCGVTGGLLGFISKSPIVLSAALEHSIHRINTNPIIRRTHSSLCGKMTKLEQSHLDILIKDRSELLERTRALNEVADSSFSLKAYLECVNQIEEARKLANRTEEYLDLRNF